MHSDAEGKGIDISLALESFMSKQREAYTELIIMQVRLSAGVYHLYAKC